MGISDLNESGIYKIESPSGNFYIGSAVNIRRRWHEHKTCLRCNRHYNQPLINAVEKYGLDAMKFSVVEFCSVDKLVEREQAAMDALQPFYNIQKTAGGNCLGMKYSEETKEKVRKAATNISDETREKRRVAAKAQWANKASRDKITKAITEAGNRPETRAKLSAMNTGRIPSEIARERMSIAAKNRKPKEARA